jgi:hypothetical protein
MRRKSVLNLTSNFPALGCVPIQVLLCLQMQELHSQLESFMMGPLELPKLSASNFKPQTKTWFV